MMINFSPEEINHNIDLILVMCPGWGVVQPPVGISYLKSFLTKYGVSVKCFDLSIEFYEAFPKKEYWDLNYPDFFCTIALFNKAIVPYLNFYIDKWAKEILKHNPKAVGFSIFMSSVNVSLILAKRLKEMKPNLIIIGGGAEVYRIKRVVVDKVKSVISENEELVKRVLKTFDLLIFGEGETTLLEIISLLKQGKKIHAVKGVIYKHKQNIIVCDSRKLINDLDILPPLDLSDFDLRSYVRKEIPLATSRGCVNKCTFCSDISLGSRGYRCQSPEKVVRDIRFIVNKYKTAVFEFTDSTFNGDMKRIDKMCGLIIDLKLKIQWFAKVRICKEMDYKFLKKMREAGCTNLSYGIESGSPVVLKDMRKGFTLKLAKKVIRDTYRTGIKANCFFIIGYPTEREKDFRLTLNFIEGNAKFIYRFDQVTGCHIEENSYLGLNIDKYGIVFKEDGWHSKESTPQIRKKRLDRFRMLARKVHDRYRYDKWYKCETQL